MLKSHSSLVGAAIVSGASVHPPNEQAPWEMPRMPTDQAWLDLIMEDVASVGMENLPDLQAKSFSFTFEPSEVVTGDKFPQCS